MTSLPMTTWHWLPLPTTPITPVVAFSPSRFTFAGSAMVKRSLVEQCSKCVTLPSPPTSRSTSFAIPA